MSHKTISGTIFEHKQIKHFIGREQPLLKPWHCQKRFNTSTFNFCTIVNLVTKVRKCDWHRWTKNVNWHISKKWSQIEVNGHLSEALPWGDNCSIEINRWQSWWGWLLRRWWWCDDDWRYCQRCVANLPISSQSTSRLHSPPRRWWPIDNGDDNSKSCS